MTRCSDFPVGSWRVGICSVRPVLVSWVFWCCFWFGWGLFVIATVPGRSLLRWPTATLHCSIGVKGGGRISARFAAPKAPSTLHSNAYVWVVAIDRFSLRFRFLHTLSSQLFYCGLLLRLSLRLSGLSYLEGLIFIFLFTGGILAWVCDIDHHCYWFSLWLSTLHGHGITLLQLSWFSLAVWAFGVLMHEGSLLALVYGSIQRASCIFHCSSGRSSILHVAYPLWFVACNRAFATWGVCCSTWGVWFHSDCLCTCFQIRLAGPICSRFSLRLVSRVR